MSAPHDAVRAEPLAGGGLQLSLQRPEGLLRAALWPRIGNPVPRHWYHVGVAVHAAPELRLFHAQRTLLLGSNRSGWAELRGFEGDIAAPASRAGWQALARAALQRVGADAATWGPGLIAELPGPRDAAGQAPFWQGLVRHFYRGDAQEAAARLGPDWRSHVAALLPRQPLYAAFLSEAAQQAIGGHAAAAQALRDGLHDAGLRWRELVTLDEGAAVLEWSP